MTESPRAAEASSASKGEQVACSFPDLTSEEHIQQLLADTDLEIARVDSQLEQARARSDVEFQLNSIAASRLKIGPTLTAAKELADQVNCVAALADNVGAHVRTLDVAKTRCEAVLARVSDILRVKDCIDGIQLAMLEEQYEEAARHVQAFRAIDQSAVDEASCEVLKAEAQKLFVRLSAQLKEAAEGNKFPEVKRFVKLVAAMGRVEEAAGQLFEFLTATLDREAAQDLEQMKVAAIGAKGSTDPGVHISPLARLFAMVASICRRNEKFVSESLEPRFNMMLLRTLHSCAEGHALAILQEVRRARHLESMVAQVEAKSKPGSETSPDEEQQRRAVDGLLDELMGLLCRCEQYFRFINDRATSCMQQIKQSTEARARSDSLSAHTGLRPNSELQMQVSQLAMQYISLEAHFLAESVQLAIAMDQASESTAGGTPSSMVEDCFFVLRRSGERAVATGNIQVMQAVVLGINDALSGALKTALEHYIQNKSAEVERAKVADAFSLSSESQDLTPALQQLAKNAAYIALNNMEVSAQYIGRLRGAIEAQLEEGFAELGSQQAELHREQLAPLLADMSEVGAELEYTAGQGQEELWGAQRSTLQPVLDGLAGIRFELTEAQHAANQAENVWVQRVVDAMQSLVNGFKAKLTAGNAEGVVQKMVVYVVGRVEQLVLQKKFNQLGGLQLDRDTRSLREFFKNVTSTSVRDKFSRLTQIANILSVEQPEEVSQYWGTDSKGWTLSSGEMIKVLRLRSDFSAAMVDQAAKQLV